MPTRLLLMSISGAGRSMCGAGLSVFRFEQSDFGDGRSASGPDSRSLELDSWYLGPDGWSVSRNCSLSGQTVGLQGWKVGR